MTTSGDRGAEPVMLQTHDLSPDLLSAALGSAAVAMDSETTGLDPKRDALKLVQVRVPDHGIELVRLSDHSDSPNLKKLLAAPTTKIFHHAMFDLGFMYERWRMPAQNIVCTKISAKLLWPSQPKNQSLQRLLANLLSVKVDKSEQTSDWASEKLTRSQLTYAARDVLYLHALAAELQTRLSDAGTLRLAVACWQHIPTRLLLNHLEVPDPFVY